MITPVSNNQQPTKGTNTVNTFVAIPENLTPKIAEKLGFVIPLRSHAGSWGITRKENPYGECVAFATTRKTALKVLRRKILDGSLAITR
jgi:hypothetical protein